jgi:periplasmic copper chaperone A
VERIMCIGPLRLRLRRSSPIVVALLLGACRSEVGGRAQLGDLTVSHAVLSGPATGPQASAFLILENCGSGAVTLLAVRSPAAESVQLHNVAGGRMQPVPQVEVPARGRLRLTPGQYHLMLEGMVHPLAIGDTVPLELDFSSGAVLRVQAPVLRYGDAVNDLAE